MQNKDKLEMIYKVASQIQNELDNLVLTKEQINNIDYKLSFIISKLKPEKKLFKRLS